MNPWFQIVTPTDFAEAFGYARLESERIHQATSEFTHEPGSFYFLSHDGYSGFVVRRDGELVNVFSLIGGRGDTIVHNALLAGAKYLDCFDGYLPTLYSRHGFVETSRERNWSPGGPDVVYMQAEPHSKIP